MNCKPGDLAIVVRAARTPQLLGHIVEVVGPFSGRVTSAGGFVWEVRYPDGRPIIAHFPKAGFRPMPTRAFNDAYLRPIRPSDLHETEDERKEVTA